MDELQEKWTQIRVPKKHHETLSIEEFERIWAGLDKSTRRRIQGLVFLGRAASDTETAALTVAYCSRELSKQKIPTLSRRASAAIWIVAPAAVILIVVAAPDLPVLHYLAVMAVTFLAVSQVNKERLERTQRVNLGFLDSQHP